MLVTPRWRVKGEFVFLLKGGVIGYTRRLRGISPTG